MRNRAKCKLCHSIIESFHSTDVVNCKCEEISVLGGNSLRCAAKNWDNFLRIDDDGAEIAVSIQEKITDTSIKPSKEGLLDMLDEMIKNIENLPQEAMLSPVNQYDLNSVLLLLSSILRA